MNEQCIRCYIEREAKETIDRALVELARETIIRDIELKERMTRRKRHRICLCWIIGDDEIAPTIRVFLTGIDDFLYLIDALTIEISPLVAIDWSEISPFFCKSVVVFYFFDKNLQLFIPFRSVLAIFLCKIIFFQIVLEWPFIPYSDIIIYEIFDIGISREKPEEFMDDAFRKYFFCRQKRKSFREIASELIAKNTTRTRSSTIVSVNTVIHDMLQKIEILLHNIIGKEFELLYEKLSYPPPFFKLIF